MKTIVIRFPGSNRDYDAIRSIHKISGKCPTIVWHQDTKIPEADLIVLPGGFSHGDYLRPGAIAAKANVIREVVNKAKNGTPIIGICNGFQILTETRLLPGALMRNKKLKFICKNVKLKVVNNQSKFTKLYKKNEIITCPIAHHDGNYFANQDVIKKLEQNEQIILKYVNNPNGSQNDIAGIVNETKNVMGLMPHPENRTEKEHGGDDGKRLIESAINVIN